MRTAEGPMEFMRACVNPLYDMTPVNSDFNRGVYATKNWLEDTQYFVRTNNDAVSVRRSKAQAENGAQLVFVKRYFGGAVRGHSDGYNIDREPGSVYIFDQARRVECLQLPTTVEGFFIRKSLLGFDSARHPPLISIHQSHPIGSVIYGLFDRIFNNLMEHDSYQKEDFTQLIACLQLAIGTDDEQGDIRRTARQALTRRIQAYIEHNVGAFDLSVTDILRTFGVSRASLYRMFEDKGGVREYISNRRLYRAVLDLTKGPILRGDISKTAELWGFSSDANFSRAVRRQLGVAPGSLVNTQVQANVDYGEASAKIIDFVAAQ